MTHLLTPLLKWAEDNAAVTNHAPLPPLAASDTLNKTVTDHYILGQHDVFNELVDKIKETIIEDVTSEAS